MFERKETNISNTALLLAGFCMQMGTDLSCSLFRWHFFGGRGVCSHWTVFINHNFEENASQSWFELGFIATKPDLLTEPIFCTVCRSHQFSMLYGLEAFTHTIVSLAACYLWPIHYVSHVCDPAQWNTCLWPFYRITVSRTLLGRTYLIHFEVPDHN